MGQTKEGAATAMATIRAKYGDDHFRVNGAKGGRVSRGGGFTYAAKNYLATDPRHPATAGRKGGKISRRGPARAEETA